MPVIVKGYSGDLSRLVREEVEDYSGALVSGIAQESTDVLRNRRRSLWPIDTGNSIRGWLVEEAPTAFGGHELLGLNDQPYARPVNNRERYSSGRRNPNYQAAQRTIIRWWQRIVEQARARIR